MDDEDSQEELINKNAALGKGKKSVLAVISDEEEEGESGDETGSEEDESEEDGDEEEGEGEDEDEDLEDGTGSDEEDEAEDEEESEGAVGGADPMTSKPAANGSRSSDEEGENCPICLNIFRDQVVGTPENCNHYFCLDCIVEWAKNANSCPVDRIAFSCICIRAHFEGAILKKVPIENHATKDAEDDDDDDSTNCEVCGRSDREDRLLLCDGCDSGYHMECLNPPLNAIPVDEWFCPECAVTNPPADEEEHISDAEVATLTAEVQPIASRLRTNVGRTRAIARTRQSERVRETVNRLRTTTARRNEHVPRYLISSLLDETIDAVVAGLNTAVYQRPLTPRVKTTRKKKTGRRRKGTGRKKPRGKVTTGSWMTGKKTKKRRRRFKGRKGKRVTARKEVTTRTRIAKTLGLCKPVRGVSIPAVQRSSEPSLGLLRSDIGAASLSVFGDPFALDPYDSQEDQSTGPPSPLSTKRRVLSRSALRSHQPVARPISVGLSRRAGAASVHEHTGPTAATPAPVPDLLGSILSEQSRLMMSSSDIVINRDGSLLARKAANTSAQKSGSGDSREGGTPGDNRQGSSTVSGTSAQTSSTTNTETPPSTEPPPPIRPASTSLFPISPSYSSSPRSLDWMLNPTSKQSGASLRFNSSFTPRAIQVQNIASASRIGLKPTESPRFNGNNKKAVPSIDGNGSQSSTSRGGAAGHPPEPGAKRIELSELPRIPKIKREVLSEHPEPTVLKGGNSISDAWANRLSGKGDSHRQSRFSAVESNKQSSKEPQEPLKLVGSVTTPGVCSASAPLGPGDKSSDSSALGAAGLKITINAGAGLCNRLFSPSTSSPFRPAESKAPPKPEPPPQCPNNKKEKLVKNEIYDPFDPTGSNSSSACSSPEREEPPISVPELPKTSPELVPEVSRVNPEVSLVVPEVSRVVPEISLIPEVTRTVPEVEVTRTVPEAARTIPEVTRVFPEVTRTFPEVTRVFPEVTRTFPEVTRKLPEVTMTFPKVTMKFPDVNRKFTDVTRKFPEVTRKFPEVTRTFPEVTRTFPEVTRTFPEVSLKFPEVTRKLPEVTRTFPEVASKFPEITRKFPGISRTVPEVTRTFPSDGAKPGAFRSFRLLTTSNKVGVSGLGSDFVNAPSPSKTIHRDVLFEDSVRDGGSSNEGDKDNKWKEVEQDKIGGKESYRNFHASVTVKLSPERTKSVEVASTWCDTEERTVASVKSDPDTPPGKNKQQKPKRPHRDAKSRSRSRSNSSSRSRKRHKKEKKLLSKERKKKRSKSRSRSQSRDRKSRSASLSTEDERVKKTRHKNKGKKVSSDHSSSSSRERSKKKKMKEMKKNKKKSSSSKDRKKTRSRSVSHGSSSSEFYESKKKKKRRSRSRERSRSSSIDKDKRRKHKAEKNYDRYDKEGSGSRFRERRRSKEKKRVRSRSTSPQVSKEYKRARSKEKWPPTKERRDEVKEAPLSPHRVVKLTGTYVENVPKLTVSYVENIPKRTVHSLVVNPDGKETFTTEGKNGSSDTSFETDSDVETSDEENESKDVKPQVIQELACEALSISGDNDSSPCESPNSSPRLEVTESIGSDIAGRLSIITPEMTPLKVESIIEGSPIVEHYKKVEAEPTHDSEAMQSIPEHKVDESTSKDEMEHPAIVEEIDDVEKMLDDDLNIVHSVCDLVDNGAHVLRGSTHTLDDGEHDQLNNGEHDQLDEGMHERLGNTSPCKLGEDVPDELGTGVHDSLGDHAPDRLVDGLLDNLGDGLQDKLGDGMQDKLGDGMQDDLEEGLHDTLGDGMHEKMNIDAHKRVGSDADSEVDNLDKEIHEAVEEVEDEKDNEDAEEDDDRVEGVAVDLLDDFTGDQIDDFSSDQVDDFSGDRAHDFAGNQAEDTSAHPMDNFSSHGVDRFSSPKEDFAVSRSDGFVSCGTDDFAGHGVDSYSGKVVDSFTGHQVDEFAGHPMDELAGKQVEEFTGHQVDSFADHHMGDFVGQRTDNFGDRVDQFAGLPLEDFARHLLDKFASHGLGSFASHRMDDVPGNQVVDIPGLCMDNVSGYQEEDVAGYQDDDDDYVGDQSEMESASQSSALKSKTQVKRVTWNLQEEDSDTSTSEKAPISGLPSLSGVMSGLPFYKLLRSKEGPWKPPDSLNQTLNPVYSPDVPLTPPQPSSLPPFAPVSEPSVNYIMQGSIPLLGCMAGSSVTSEPGNLATASEPGTQSASTGDAEEKTTFLKPSLDRITQEYMKKLHIQERAVEEVKLAIKPFYQSREITKDEYKDILRKAVSKICHSKSGEINPVKVANLIKAYVERYKHLRKHKRDSEEYHDLGAESP